MSTYRSPDGPPLRPASPSRAKRIRSPLSTPAGTLTDSVLFLRTRPRPPHSRHGLSIVAPAPPQLGQVCWIEKKPCATRTWPTPLHVLQLIGCEPGSAPFPVQRTHSTCAGISSVIESPATACSS